MSDPSENAAQRVHIHKTLTNWRRAKCHCCGYKADAYCNVTGAHCASCFVRVEEQVAAATSGNADLGTPA